MFATSRDALEVLIAAGADVNAVDGNGRTVFSRIGAGYNATLLDVLVAAGATPTRDEVTSLADRAAEELEFRGSHARASGERIDQLREFKRWCEEMALVGSGVLAFLTSKNNN
jgi:hypothetical protein